MGLRTCVVEEIVLPRRDAGRGAAWNFLRPQRSISWQRPWSAAAWTHKGGSRPFQPDFRRPRELFQLLQPGAAGRAI